MRTGQRMLRALFVALAVGLGWGIRGNFGHQLGAMLPGALLGLSLGYVSGQERMFRLLPLLGFIGAVSMGLGGTMSYGILHGYASSPNFVNAAYGFLTLFLEGAAWGGPCGAALGLLLEDERVKLGEWASTCVATLVAAVVTHLIVVNLIGFHLNPPRSDIAIAFFGGMGGLFFWLHREGKKMGLKGALYGFLGFGIGMSLSRFLGNLSHIIPVEYDNWKVMEISCGLIGGFILSYALLGKQWKAYPIPAWMEGVGVVGIFFVMFWMPLLHRVQRIPLAKITSDLTGQGAQLRVANPAEWAPTLLHIIDALLVVGLIGGVVWYILYRRNATKWVAFPALFLALDMLLIDNMKSLFPFTLVSTGSFRVELTFWFIFLAMVLFVALWRRHPALREDEQAERLGARRAILASVVLLVAMILANYPINPIAKMTTGKQPAAGSNGRFPVSSMRDDSM